MDDPSTSSSGRAFPLPTISEDTLHYVLHVPAQPQPPAASQGGGGGEQADLAALATLISEFVSSLLPDPWLWNKDAWELKVAGSDGSGVKQSHGGREGDRLEGTMRVGDAVDDEWLVVWLLREVSRRWKEPVISIRDTDGEFLLIEAAHALPDWVSPENATNRLWLHNGHLHLLPLSVRSGSRPRQLADSDYDSGVDTWINEEDAVRAVRTGRYAAPEVENAVWERISCYPAALKTHQHRAKAYLPVPVARALRGNPELIQRAVEGFYVRDPSQLRAASRMTHFPPSPAVLVTVPMTRAAYAQLQGQVFHPPRVFGTEWHVREDQGDSERRWRDLGVKIATGFEIMYREGGRKGRVADASASPEDLVNEPGYARYIDDLQKAGFFGDEVRGSAKWKSREAEAARGWVEARSSDTTQQRPSFAYLVDSAIASTKPEDVEKDTGEEDSDKWLEVDPDELDAMMKRAAGGGAMPRGADGELGAEHGKALKDLAGQLEAFVGGEGDLEGARFADELSDDDMDSASESGGDDEPAAADREERLRNLVAALPAGEWGAATRPNPEFSDDEDDEDVDMASVPSNRKGTVAGSAYGDSLLPPSMRPPMFEKVHYDGVESDSSDEDEDDLPPKGTLGRHISDMKWGDGASRTQPEATIEEIDEDEDGEDKADRERREALKFDDDIDELMRQRVWGGGDDDMEEGQEEGKKGKRREEDVDMDGDQTAEFLKFARAELGIDEDMWSDILAQRRARGAFVPETTTPSKAQAASVKEAAPKSMLSPSTATKAPRPDTSSFESMMAAMDGELARHVGTSSSPAAPKPAFTKPASAPASSSSKKKQKKAKATVSFAETDEPDEPSPAKQGGEKGKGKGKGKSKFTSLASLPDPDELDSLSDDALAQMDAELRAALKESGADPDDDEDAQGLEGDERVQYNMLKDMLESYASQGGQAGPMGNLVGRLGEVASKPKK